ncbi:ArsR family transcriptional regulator [Streptomyces sp. HUAS MG91]|uniref:ArsR family transcriptional regulator n=1 Tax=Streptomyces tabacisoli TaxID=3156398 RepID=A0AAU8J379_9ACTN
MISFVLGVADLAATRFALSPVHEAVLSLRVLQDPGLTALHLPWRRRALDTIRGTLDTDLLMSLVARRRTLPDFLTPLPHCFAPSFEEQLARVRHTPADRVRDDLLLAHHPDPLPPPLRTDDHAALRDRLCDLLEHYWRLVLAPDWGQMRLLLEADMTYRARQLALGGAQALFTGIHPNLSWTDGTLHIDKLIGRRTVDGAGRGLLLLPSVFAHKPAPPVGPGEPPSLVYPCRGLATLRTAPPPVSHSALVDLLGASRARLLTLLSEPLPTVELARRLHVTPSAVSQHLRVLHATGLVTRARDGRQVLYRRSRLGDELMG